MTRSCPGAVDTTDMVSSLSLAAVRPLSPVDCISVCIDYSDCLPLCLRDWQSCIALSQRKPIFWFPLLPGRQYLSHILYIVLLLLDFNCFFEWEEIILESQELLKETVVKPPSRQVLFLLFATSTISKRPIYHQFWRFLLFLTSKKSS